MNLIQTGEHTWASDDYAVTATPTEFAGLKEPGTHLKISRADGQPARDWRDLQAIKSAVCGPEREAVELFPAESRLRDIANTTHLWVYPEGYIQKIGFRRGRELATGDHADGQAQRPRAGGRTIYIDCGAWKGKTVRAWLREHHADEVHAFEPCRAAARAKHWHIVRGTYPIVRLHHEAVWTEDGEIDFFHNPLHPDSQSGTVCPEKTSGGIDTRSPAARVKCIDFARWFAERVGPNDVCHLKMDIEGAEYAVLERMRARGLFNRITTMTIEFHADKMGARAAELRAVEERLRCQLIEAGVELAVQEH